MVLLLSLYILYNNFKVRGQQQVKAYLDFIKVIYIKQLSFLRNLTFSLHLPLQEERPSLLFQFHVLYSKHYMHLFFLSICLCSRTPHCWAFTLIQHFRMYPCSLRSPQPSIHLKHLFLSLKYLLLAGLQDIHIYLFALSSVSEPCILYLLQYFVLCKILSPSLSSYLELKLLTTSRTQDQIRRCGTSGPPFDLHFQLSFYKYKKRLKMAYMRSEPDVHFDAENTLP